MSIGRVLNKYLQETIRGPTLKFARMVDIDVVNKKKIITKFLKNVFSGVKVKRFKFDLIDCIYYFQTF